VTIDGRDHDIGTLRDVRARTPRTRVRSWKGRAAMSAMTDSAVPTFITAGTRRTRVSEMRLPARVALLRDVPESADSDIANSARRHRRPLQPFRWSG